MHFDGSDSAPAAVSDASGLKPEFQENAGRPGTRLSRYETDKPVRWYYSDGTRHSENMLRLSELPAFLAAFRSFWIDFRRVTCPTPACKGRLDCLPQKTQAL